MLRINTMLHVQLVYFTRNDLLLGITPPEQLLLPRRSPELAAASFKIHPELLQDRYPHGRYLWVALYKHEVRFISWFCSFLIDSKAMLFVHSKYHTWEIILGRTGGRDVLQKKIALIIFNLSSNEK